MGASQPLLKWAALALFAAANMFITLAFGVAPTGSDAVTNANLYKAASLLLGLAVLWLSLRRQNYLMLVGFAVLQLLAFHRFSETLNAGAFGG